jgi:hypothetical protein
MRKNAATYGFDATSGAYAEAGILFCTVMDVASKAFAPNLCGDRRSGRLTSRIAAAAPSADRERPFTHA